MRARGSIHVLGGMLFVLSATTMVSAQQSSGQVATSAVGTAGERQTRAGTAALEGLARVDSRIQNRIQSRLRSRIDPFYNPQVDAAASIDAASDQARVAGQTQRR